MPYADTPIQANTLSLINYEISQGLKFWYLTTKGLKENVDFKQGKCKTVPYDPATNTAKFHAALGAF
eukprot:5564024-Ditylum_brightwellii.AAC.1